MARSALSLSKPLTKWLDTNWIHFIAEANYESTGLFVGCDDNEEDVAFFLFFFYDILSLSCLNDLSISQ